MFASLKGGADTVCFRELCEKKGKALFVGELFYWLKGRWLFLVEKVWMRTDNFFKQDTHTGLCYQNCIQTHTCAHVICITCESYHFSFTLVPHLPHWTLDDLAFECICLCFKCISVFAYSFIPIHFKLELLIITLLCNCNSSLLQKKHLNFITMQSRINTSLLWSLNQF